MLAPIVTYPSAHRIAWYGAFIRCADPIGAGTPGPEKYSVASQTDSATPASTSDVSICCPAPVRCGDASAARIAGQREQRGAEIGQRHPRFHRRAARFTGDRHDAGDALRDQIEAALRAIRPVCP